MAKENVMKTMLHPIKYGLAIGGTACVLVFSSATAQKPHDNDRLARIESAIADLQSVLYSVEGPAQTSPPVVYGTVPDDSEYNGTGHSDLAVRMDLIERELQTMTGRMEQIAHMQEINGRRLDTLAAALNVSFARQASMAPSNPTENVDAPIDPSVGVPYAAPFQSDARAPQEEQTAIVTQDTDTTYASGVQVTDFPSTSSPTPTSPNVLFDRGYSAMLQGDYRTAGKDFKDFLARYPDDPQAPEAQFRLGEVYLAIGDNAAAARAFYDHAKKWPDNKRAAETYMRLGIAFARAGKKTEACQILKALPSKFPTLDASQQDRLELAKEEAGC